MDGVAKDEIPRAAPAIPVTVKSNGRLRCVCRRTVRVLNCATLVRWTCRFETASALAVNDHRKVAGWAARPTRTIKDAIVQYKDAFLPAEYSPNHVIVTTASLIQKVPALVQLDQQLPCLTRTLNNSRCSQSPMTVPEMIPCPPGARPSRVSSNPAVYIRSS